MDSGVCRFLLEASAQVSARDDCNHTPLHFADDADMAQLLITAGAELNPIDGLPPFHVASMYGNAPMVQKLLIMGADSRLK